MLAVRRVPAAPLMLIAAVIVGYVRRCDAAGAAPSPSAWSGHLTLPTCPLDWRELWRALRAAGAAAAAAHADQRGDRHGAGLPRPVPRRAARASERNLRPARRASPTCCWPVRRACRCATARAACRRSTGSARAPGWRRSCWARCCWCSGSASPPAPPPCSRSSRISAVGALLLVAGVDLAVSRRLFDAQPSCWPVIAVAAGRNAALEPGRRPRGRLRRRDRPQGHPARHLHPPPDAGSRLLRPRGPKIVSRETMA